MDLLLRCIRDRLTCLVTRTKQNKAPSREKRNLFAHEDEIDKKSNFYMYDSLVLTIHCPHCISNAIKISAIQSRDHQDRKVLLGLVFKQYGVEAVNYEATGSYCSAIFDTKYLRVEEHASFGAIGNGHWLGDKNETKIVCEGCRTFGLIVSQRTLKHTRGSEMRGKYGKTGSYIHVRKSGACWI
jgi:hypothetical protein